MGWTDSHLHEFEVRGDRYTHPSFIQDGFDDFGAKSYAVHSLQYWISRYGHDLRMKYSYDFGDGWEHKVVLEETFPAEPSTAYPRCVAGKLACPPEDVGGVWGYYNFVSAITDPEHERHEELLEWHGPFDPDEFNPTEATALMQACFNQ